MGTLHRKFTKEFKEEVIDKIRNEGKAVTAVAESYGIRSNLIYRWLSSSINPDPNTLELNRLRRERDELLKLVGELTRDMKRGKKD